VLGVAGVVRIKSDFPFADGLEKAGFRTLVPQHGKNDGGAPRCGRLP
jgi:hypothetical protein